MNGVGSRLSVMVKLQDEKACSAIRKSFNAAWRAGEQFPVPEVATGG